ncbi:unnamed protein product [Thlaspi arvense]|uniref:ABC transporter domain-containing protein n=1 Tax=Thlaspi arvense TaxID=13288 RepID=A0AAU9SIS3_THLAR|nr:unnamed protein product [Thlaspi arvense]
MKSKPNGKGSKTERLSVTALLARMDQKHDKSSSSSSSNAAPNPSSYTYGIDFPPPYVEDASDEKQEQTVARRNHKPELDIHISDKELKRRAKKERSAFENAEIAKSEASKENLDAFTVVIGSKASVLEGQDTANANVKDISIDSFSVSVCGKDLLKNVSVKLSHGKRYGLVGPNGTGKSTLLKLLASRKIPVPKNIDMLLVKQEVVADDETTALEAVVSANEELVKLKEEAEALEKSGDGEDGDSGQKLTEVYKRLKELDSDSAKAQAAKILAGLGFTEDDQKRPTGSFSGGWRMRISLARTLFMQPTLLLLDEPTNHLDLEADFLNTVCTNMIALHDKGLHSFRGNHDDYKSAYEKQCNEVNKKLEIRKKQDEAAKRSGDVAQQKKAKDKSKTKGEEGPAPRKSKKVVLDFSEPTFSASSLLRLIEVSFCYPEKPDFRLSNVDVSIDMGTRVAIVGPNGAGKSTLLNLLAGDLVPTEGEVRRCQKLRIGRYSQHFVDLLTMEETPVKYLLRLHPDQEGFSKQEAVRAKLGKFGLPSNNHETRITDLSGGQKARVVFTSISMSKPHILLLDEPTNHLDEETIDALANTLDKFTGGVVLVSHDTSRVVSRVCDDEEKGQIWVVKDGTVTLGTYEEYIENLQS